MIGTLGGWTRIREHWQEPLYRNSYFLIANNLAIAGSGFLFWLLAARVVAPSTLGLATAAVGALMMIAMLARLGLDIGLLRELPVASDDRTSSLLDTAFTVSTIAAAIATAVFIVGLPLWSPDLMLLRNPTYALGFFGAAVVLTWAQLMDSALVARRRADLVFVKNAAHAVLKIATVYVASAAFGAIGLAASATLTIIVPLVAVASLPGARPHNYAPRVRIVPEIVAETARSSAVNYVVAFVLAAPLSLGVILALGAYGPAAAAVFYILMMFGSVAMMAPMAFGQTLLVEFMRNDSARPHVLRRPLAISALGGLTVLALGPILFPLLGPGYSHLRWQDLLPFALAVMPGLLLHRNLALFRARQATWWLLGSAFALVGLFIGGLVALRLPVEACGWLWAGAHVVAATTSQIGSHRFRGGP